MTVVTAVVVTQCGAAGEAAASNYAAAWQRQDFAAMYSMLSTESQQKVSLDRFSKLQRDAIATATVRTLTAGEPHGYSNGAIKVPFTVSTRAFGTRQLDASIPLTDDDSEAKVVWSESLLLPGVRAGEHLSRETAMPPRAALYAADGSVLAKGPDRASDIPDVSAQIAGTVAAPTTTAELGPNAFGYPQGTPVGQTGLERVFQEQLAGRPGGTLRSGARLLAESIPQAGKSIHTTIVPAIERAAVQALAGRPGGIAVTVPKTGEILAAAGSAFSATAPPGSTFKIVTASAVLADGLATPDSTYAYASAASLDGRMLQNAGGETCGGTLVQAFAASCNSVFAPLGAKLGSAKLVDMATRYGFNHSIPGVPGAAVSTIPTADRIVGDDATGSTAIGQGQTAASALQMTTTAATVAAGGFRAQPTLVKTRRPNGWRVTSPKVASDMRRLMLAVVRSGTGFAAAIPGVPVAGKTGTAELVDTTSPDVVAGDPKNTDAWFVAFAPAWNARIAVGVELDGAGHGGDSAAPAAHDVLVAALQHTR